MGSPASRSERSRAVLDALLLPLLLPVAVAGTGVLAGQWLTLDVRAGGGFYGWLTSALLAVGLYGSAAGIARPHARGDVYRIVVAITFGVVVKAAFIAGALYLAYRDRPEYLVLAVAMAQIDPLSVSAMLESRDMSRRAKSLLAAWASFDDPVTTVLVVVLGSMVLKGTGSVASGTADYAQTLLGNLLLLTAAALVWLVIRRRAPAGPPVSGTRRAVQIAALVALLAVATWQFLMLGLALAALFFRPALGRWLGRATNTALFVATFLLGMLLARGAEFAVGAVLGLATFTAQILVGAVVSLGYSRPDRASLCLSQQNGITAIILALLLEPRLSQAVAIVAPAILVVNVLHLASNGLLGRARRNAAAADRKTARAPDTGDSSPVPEAY
ncbi:hypothetical protein [Streptomyces dysideae]|uniref:Cation/H+ exchanger domain-containing protein n=1 Tax=Streptomyces dysideae TaxID=909626 RepID=A0A101V0D6_9ACTN|nr:hypothetical protein [Streptomyces dysideae]KUO20220.1 hypothetical protein AQJ91_15700 [Streptomyces dysideae]